MDLKNVQKQATCMDEKASTTTTWFPFLSYTLFSLSNTAAMHKWSKISLVQSELANATLTITAP